MFLNLTWAVPLCWLLNPDALSLSFSFSSALSNSTQWNYILLVGVFAKFLTAFFYSSLNFWVKWYWLMKKTNYKLLLFYFSEWFFFFSFLLCCKNLIILGQLHVACAIWTSTFRISFLDLFFWILKICPGIWPKI